MKIYVNHNGQICELVKYNRDNEKVIVIDIFGEMKWVLKSEVTVADYLNGEEVKREPLTPASKPSKTDSVILFFAGAGTLLFLQQLASWLF